MQTEIILMWLGVSLYAASSVLFVVSLVFKRPGLTRIALGVALLGLLPHTVGIGVRWARVGHGPYLGFFEVVSTYAWVSVLSLGLLAWRRPALRPIGVILMPISFLMLGGAMFAPQADLAMTGRLASWWLTIHVAFAKLSYGAFIGSFALALVYLYRERAGGTLAEALSKLPDQDVLDDLQFRFVSVGFVFLGMMIVAGAIWANEAWGRYWAWDPIETWSLISWLIYAAYLHARLTLGWRGKRSAVFAMLALPVILFSFIGVPLVYKSIHGAYLIGY